MVNYKKKYQKFAENFDPEAYGYTWEEYNSGDIDIYEEWVYSSFGNSGMATFFRDNRARYE